MTGTRNTKDTEERRETGVEIGCWRIYKNQVWWS